MMKQKRLFNPKVFLCVWVFILSVFCVSSLSQTCPSPYGINAHVPDSAVLQLIQEAGIKWIRMDFDWSEIETSEGHYNWSVLENRVDEARARGLCILANIHGTPSWASTGGETNDPPSDKVYWTNFIKEVVTRFQNKIKYWAMWNEANLEEFWKGTVDDYMNLILIPGAETAKTFDPSCKIVGPDLAHLHSRNSKWNIWMRQIFRKGGNEHLDVISHHIYDSSGPSGIFNKLEKDQAPLIPSVFKVLEEEGVDNKPFWITETGWNTRDVSEDTQSDYYLEFLQNLEYKPSINKIFFYQIIDDAGQDAPQFGIVASNYTPKKAYYTYKDFIAGLYPPVEPPPEDDEEGICPFIGSAQLSGTAQLEKLEYVRYTRDNILKKTLRGNNLVRIYYKHAPEIHAILMENPRALWLAAECSQPVIQFCQELCLKGKDNIPEKYLSDDEFRNIQQLIGIFKYFARPELKEILAAIEKDLPRYREKSLNSLIIDLDFDPALFRPFSVENKRQNK